MTGSGEESISWFSDGPAVFFDFLGRRFVVYTHAQWVHMLICLYGVAASLSKGRGMAASLGKPEYKYRLPLIGLGKT